MRQLDRERFLADANEAAAAEQRLLLFRAVLAYLYELSTHTVLYVALQQVCLRRASNFMQYLLRYKYNERRRPVDSLCKFVPDPDDSTLRLNRAGNFSSNMRSLLLLLHAKRDKLLKN
jgi:hypothetical protein